MSLATPEFVIPDRQLPDGSYTFKEHRSATGLVEALKEYDPRLSLVINTKDDRWELWRLGEDNKARRIGTLPDRHRIPSATHLIAQLKAHDTRLGYDPVEDMIATEAADERRRDRDFGDYLEDRGDRLHHALANDLSSHAPAARPIPLGGRRR